MRRVVIADDEPLARKRLRMMLGRLSDYEIVAEATDGVETVEALIAQEPDILFLDVKMPGLDGFEVLAAVGSAKRPPAIVFVTAFADRAVGAFDENAADFLLKPYSAERFRRALDRAEQRLDAEPASHISPTTRQRDVLEGIERPAIADRFLVRGPSHLYFVKVEDVEWIDAAANYVRLHVGGRTHFVRETVKAIAQRLPADRFVRVHRSIIVNLDFVQRLEPYEHGEYVITMRDGGRVQSSRTYNQQLRAVLQR